MNTFHFVGGPLLASFIVACGNAAPQDAIATTAQAIAPSSAGASGTWTDVAQLSGTDLVGSPGSSANGSIVTMKTVVTPGVAPGVAIFVRPQGGWSGQPVPAAILTSTDAAASSFESLAASSDGSVVVATSDEAQGVLVLVWKRPNGGWKSVTQTAELHAASSCTPSVLEGPESVAVSSDGAPVVFGYACESNGLAGEAAVYTEGATGWTDMPGPTASLSASDATLFLGYAVAIAGDAIVATDASDTAPSAAYVFAKPSGGWVDASQTAKLTSSDGVPLDGFGGSASILGSTIVVGADSVVIDGEHQGKAYVFEKPSAGWKDAAETAQLTASDGTTNDAFGFPVFIASTAAGPTVIAAANLENHEGKVSQGAVYTFVKPSGGWTDSTETTEISNPNPKDRQFGIGLSAATSLLFATDDSDKVIYAYQCIAMP
jgi:hypothetical protein